jgi:hypothetical protein
MQDQATRTKRIQENNTLHSHRPVKDNLNINTRSQRKTSQYVSKNAEQQVRWWRTPEYVVLQ